MAWSEQCRCLSDLLHAENPVELIGSLFEENATLIAAGQVRMLAPIDRQEVWAAGVTYRRSQVARMEESEAGASHYDRVYTAPRPELFFKANPRRVSGPGEPVRIRTDTKWSVPEPELALYVNRHGVIVGYTIGNDLSCRDIEGENPLYLPQAKVWDGSAALGPALYVPDVEGTPLPAETEIALVIARDGREVVTGRTTLYGFYLFTELLSERGSVGLRRLAELVAAGQLVPHISLEKPWTEIAAVAQDLLDRRFPGKAVLTLD